MPDNGSGWRRSIPRSADGTEGRIDLRQRFRRMNHRSVGSLESPAPRTWSRDEAVCEVRIDCQRLADSELLHHDKTQAVHEAVRLVAVALEVLERGAFFVRRRPVDRCDLLAVQLLTQTRGSLMADLARQRDRLGHDMVRRHEMISQLHISEGLESLDDARMMLVFRRDQCEEKSGVDEGHSRGRPYRYWSWCSAMSAGASSMNPISACAAVQPVGSSSDGGGVGTRTSTSVRSCRLTGSFG